MEQTHVSPGLEGKSLTEKPKKNRKNNNSNGGPQPAENNNKKTKNKKNANNEESNRDQKKDPRMVWVANMHLEGDPYQGGTRLNQLKSMLKSIQTKQKSFGVSPAEACTIVCGDFNSSEDGAAYRALADGKLKPGFTELGRVVTETEYKHDFDFASAYASLHPLHEEPEVSFAVKGFHQSCLDFIFFSKPTLKAAAVMQVIPDEDREMVLRQLCIPNHKYPSDHLPVAALIERTAEQAK